MPRSNRQRLLALVFVLWICYTIILSLIRLPETVSNNRFPFDKLFHLTSYLVMALLGADLIRGWVLIPGLAIAVATELGQRFLPYRTASWLDFACNLLGLGLGFGSWWLVRGRKVRLSNQD